jgi:hypothetical protein
MEKNNRRDQLEQMLVERAMKDDAFRKELLLDPKRVIERETNTVLPSSISINVVQEDAHTVYLVLPGQASPQTGDELTEVELEAVSGGFDWSLATDCGSCKGGCTDP